MRKRPAKISTIAIPKIVVLDTATIGKVSRDYWDIDNASLREKARNFIARLQNLDVYVALTLIHLSELLRHENESVTRERIKFLRGLPLIAWLRPYDRSWFPAEISNLLLYELHAVVNRSAKDWQEIVNDVRQQLWETGTGSEMFVENDELWSIIKKESIKLHEKEKYTASMDRVDPDQIMNLKLSEILKFPIRAHEKRIPYMGQYAKKMERQLESHGDIRLNNPHKAAFD